MRQQNEKEDEVEVRDGAVEQCRQRPEQRSQELWDVVEVSRHAPPPGHKEDTLSLSPLASAVRGPDQLRSLTPNGARPIGVPHLLPLPVRVVVKEDRDESDDHHGDREWEAELVWMCGKKESMACIDGGHPHHTTPTLEEGGRVREGGK